MYFYITQLFRKLNILKTFYVFININKCIANEPLPNIRRILNSKLYTARTIKNKNNSANKYIDNIIKEAEKLQIDIREIVTSNLKTTSPHG